MQKLSFDRDGSPQGPYEPKELRTLAKAGLLTPATLVWKEGESAKIEAGRIRGLFPATAPQQAQQSAEATGVVVLSYILFYAYLTKCKQLIESEPVPDAN